MWISKRNQEILSGLIDIFLETHKPVSSRDLSARSRYSSSTLRKDLQYLEAQGFLFKPSPSAGRIPTNRAIKFYFRCLLENRDLSIPPIPPLAMNSSDIDFQHLSEDFLSGLTDQTRHLGFIFLNSIFDLNFSRIRLVKIGSSRIMAIVTSLNNWSISKVFTTKINYSETELGKWQSILNREFRGKNLNSVFKTIRNRLFREKEKFKKIYHELYFLLSNEDMMTAEFFFKGTQNILDSDLINPGKARLLLETLEEKVKFSKFLNDLLHNNSKKPGIVFGSDTGISDLDDFILIFSNFYYTSNPIGNIGIIGPKFMPYPNTLTSVEQYSSYFSEILSKKATEV